VSPATRHLIPASAILLALIASASACAIAETSPAFRATATDSALHPLVTLDTTERHQTINGWEAVAQAGHELPEYPRFRDTLMALAANEVGIDRVRLEVRSGMENPRDYEAERGRNPDVAKQWACTRYATENDNADPFVIDTAGFKFGGMAPAVERVVLPLARRLEARGERLHLNVTYVAFVSNMCPGYTYHHDKDAEEYAEFALAVFQHLRDRYGLVPDSWELVLEPDPSIWTGEKLGRALVATSRRLRANGFSPEFVGPSTVKADMALPLLDAMLAVPGARQALTEISYHRYGLLAPRAPVLRAIGERGTALGLRTSMLEHIGSGYENLHADLELANVSAWSQYTLAYTGGDNGGHYFRIELGGGTPVVETGRRTMFLAQYFRHVRRGAVRVGAASANSSVHPLGFLNANGSRVVVVKADGPASISVAGLAPGRYEVTAALERGPRPPAEEVDVAPGQYLNARIAHRGVLTVVGR
jgi:hypothetical protein